MLRAFLKMAEVRAVLAFMPARFSWKKECVSASEPRKPRPTRAAAYSSPCRGSGPASSSSVATAVAASTCAGGRGALSLLIRMIGLQFYLMG